MNLCVSRTLVLVLTLSLLETIVLHVASGLPVKRRQAGELPGVDAMNQSKENVVDKEGKDMKDDDVSPNKDFMKFEKEEQIGDPSNVEKKVNVHHEELKVDLEMAKKIEKLPEEELKPVDHVEGVKMEHDGHINDKYHKEMFLGGAHDEFNHETFDEAEDKLKEIVAKADTNKDKYLDKEEMEAWVLKNMKEHFQEAEEENARIFKHLDPDGDGFVTWKEYYLHFLLSRGYEVEKAVKHVKDYDYEMGAEDLLLAEKDMLMTYKFKWTDADKEPVDNQLSKAEFMVFRHPEHSKISLQMMVENVLQGVDQNNDGMVSMEEYAALPPGEVEGGEFQAMDKRWQEDRRTEFRTIMDINHDGQVTSEELKRYLDPTNPIQAKIETESLLSLIDDNRDKRLSEQEILSHSEIFITSKLANFGANVHDEF